MAPRRASQPDKPNDGRASSAADRARRRAAAPRCKLPKNWSALELLAGRYNRAPAKRHAVREEQVYAALRELGEATTAELARHTGQDRGNVHRRVQKLLEQGLIERHVTSTAIIYRVRSSGSA